MAYAIKHKDYLEDLEVKILEHHNDDNTIDNYVIDHVSDSLNGISVEAKYGTILWCFGDYKVKKE